MFVSDYLRDVLISTTICKGESSAPKGHVARSMHTNRQVRRREPDQAVGRETGPRKVDDFPITSGPRALEARVLRTVPSLHPLANE
jgi:hypothetical protein